MSRLRAPLPLSRVRSAAMLLVLLSVWAFAAGSSLPEYDPEVLEAAGGGDLGLYERIVDSVKSGEWYYDAAVELQRSFGYPTSPPTTIRLPTLTLVVSTLGPLTPWALAGLVVVAVVLTMFQLEKASPSRVEWYASSLLLALGLGVYTHPQAVYLHEAWAIVFMMLAIALPRRFGSVPPLILGVIAVCFRELAWPFLIVMGILGWNRGRRESMAWFAAAVTFLGAYAVHWMLAGRAAENATQGVVESKPWVVFGGWPHAMDTFVASSVFGVGPYSLAVLVVAGSLLGWMIVGGRARNAILATSATFLIVFTVAGRPNTAYWGHLYAAMLLPGLAFFPRAAIRMLTAPREP